MSDTTQQTRRPLTRRERVERLLLGAVLVLLAALLLLVGAWWYLFVRTQHDIPAGQGVQIEIPSGSSTAQIAERLARAGVIDNSNMFRLRVRVDGADGRLKAGIYDLATGMEYDAVTEVLLEGPSLIYLSVTIPEGFVIEQIAERLESEAGIPATEFTTLAKGGADQFRGEHPYLGDAHEGSLEGYLFPKTYRIREGSSASDVIEMMLDQFDKEIVDLDLSLPQAKGMSLHEVVTLASMIEREVRIPEERELVSSVIHNRLDAGMLLEIDATIEYVLPGNRFRLRASDLKVDSPFNTYRNPGLPPGPIASPGLAALEAACAPAQTDYLYYVLTAKDGTHTFAVTREEFLIAKQRSKEVFGQ